MISFGQYVEAWILICKFNIKIKRKYRGENDKKREREYITKPLFINKYLLHAGPLKGTIIAAIRPPSVRKRHAISSRGGISSVIDIAVCDTSACTRRYLLQVQNAHIMRQRVLMRVAQPSSNVAIRVLMDLGPFAALSARNSICIVRSAQPRVTRLPGLSQTG